MQTITTYILKTLATLVCVNVFCITTQAAISSRYIDMAITREVILLSRNYEFIYFYSGDCQHCLSFNPVLKRYASKSGIAVKAFMFGDKTVAYFAESVPVERVIVEQYFGKEASLAVPALFILNKDNYHVYPVSKGSLSYSELTARMNVLAPKIIRNEMHVNNRRYTRR